MLLLSSLGSNWQWHQINNFTFFGLLSVCGSLLRWYWLGEGELWKLIVSLVTRIKGKKSEKNRRQIKKEARLRGKQVRKDQWSVPANVWPPCLWTGLYSLIQTCKKAYILTFLYVYMLVLQGWLIVLTFMFPCTVVLQFDQLKLVRWAFSEQKDDKKAFTLFVPPSVSFCSFELFLDIGLHIAIWASIPISLEL